MFSKDTTKAIDNLHKKSGRILDIFTSTITDLHTVNGEIDEHIELRNQEIAQIQKEHARLYEIKGGNTKVIEKISKILE
jgi:hypothetical protein